MIDRIHRARLLAFAEDEQQILGVGALKVPDVGYRSGVFRDAVATVSPDSFGLELGWLVVDSESRGLGIGNELVAASLAGAQDEAVFATTSTSNPAMRHLLVKHEFSKHGQRYSSGRDADTRHLFIRVVA